MTEPGGAGSDPGMTLTRAERTGNGGGRLQGRKWFTTGAGEAKRFVVMMGTSEDPRRGLTAFLFHADDPGWRILRRVPIMRPEAHGGHCEPESDGLAVPDENALMGVGDGRKLTQIRLGPARLTHWHALDRPRSPRARDRGEDRRRRRAGD